MKINMLLSGCLLGLLCFTACDSEGNEMNDYTHYVNPFIGTGGHGHTHPGAMVPHGMIQPGPDTRIDGWDSCSGYYYEDTTINGFAHTRLSGTGCADFGDFLLMPTVGVQRTDFLGTESQKRPFASAFSHEKEYAEPGYYSVFLDTYGVKAELTATEAAGTGAAGRPGSVGPVCRRCRIVPAGCRGRSDPQSFLPEAAAGEKPRHA